MNTDIRLPNLLTKLAKLKKSELIDAIEEVDPETEVVIGTLPEDLKRLYTFCQTLKQAAAECQDKLQGACGKDKCAACQVNKKADLLEDYFFLCIRDQYPNETWGPPECPGIGIRKGFQVIKLVKRKGPILIIAISVGGQKPFSDN